MNPFQPFGVQSDSPGDLSIESSPVGPRFRFTSSDGFWCRVIQWGLFGDLHQMAYDWWEVHPIIGGGWEDVPEVEGGRVGGVSYGSPAYEANDQDTPDDSIVWMRAGNYTLELDSYGSGSAGSEFSSTETKDYRFAYESDELAYGASGGSGRRQVVTDVQCVDGELVITYGSR